MKKNKKIKVYGLGDYRWDTSYAIRYKDVKDINEAREIILSMKRGWQENYTDEEYKTKFGRNKVVILQEKTAYLRLLGRWECSGYEYKEYDWKMEWTIVEKGGRGAMQCYVFECKDDFREYNIYLMEKEKKYETETK